MIKAIGAITLIVFSISICQAQSQERFNTSPVTGWPGLQWGMTQTAVLEVFKGKAELIPKDQIQYPVDGAPELVRINKLVVDGVSYRVQFAFDTIPFTHWSNRRTIANGLCGFQLMNETQRKNVRRLVTTEIQPALEKNFGRPTVKEKADEFYRYYSASWRLPSTAISLELDIPQNETGSKQQIWISYSATRPPEK
jgi:hypothetical protein